MTCNYWSSLVIRSTVYALPQHAECCYNNIIMMITRSSPILASESNLRPIWLDLLSCSSRDSSLSACVGDTNIIGYADCLPTVGASIAAIDCGKSAPQLLILLLVT